LNLLSSNLTEIVINSQEGEIYYLFFLQGLK